MLYQARAAGCLSSQELADSDSSCIWGCAVSGTGLWCIAIPVHSDSESSCIWGCAIAGTSFWCIPTPVHSEYDSSCMCGVCVPHRYSHRSAFGLRVLHIAPACVEATCRSERSLWVRIAVPMPPGHFRIAVSRARGAVPRTMFLVLPSRHLTFELPQRCLGLCYISHELLVYTHPSAFGFVTTSCTGRPDIAP